MPSFLHALGRARLICGSQSTPAVAATIYELLGSSAEFVHVATQWEAKFITLRAGGPIPIARYFPGATELVG